MDKWIRRNMKSALDVTCLTWPKKLDDFLDQLKGVCQRENIPLDSVCVVGSCILAYFRIREAHDVDLIVTSNIREKYGAELYKLSSNIELVGQGWACSPYRSVICDDEVINNSKYHFIYRGFKFASIQLLYERKLYQGREKDLEDVKKMSVLMISKDC